MFKTKTKLIIFAILALVFSGVFFVFHEQHAKAAAGINKQINFQGKITNTDGTNVSNGSYNFVFSIYSQQAPGGTVIWTESKSLSVTDGIFQTNLGDTTSLPGSVDFNTNNIYLGINFNSNGEMTPRIQFTAAPYAFNSDKLEGLTWEAPGAIGSTNQNSGNFSMLNADSVSTDTGGMTIAAGQSYSGIGAVTLSSAAGSALTIDSGTTGALNIGTDGSAETISIGTGAAVKTLAIGSLNSTSGTTIQSGTSGIKLQPAGTGTSGTVQIGADAGSATPDLLGLDTGSAEPAGTNGAMYYSSALNKFRCYENGAWTNCIGSGGSSAPAGSTTQIQYNNAGALGADAGFTFDSSTQTLGLNGTDAEILMNGITNEPSVPAVGDLKFYAKSIAGRMMPKWVGPSGLDSIVQPMVAMNKVAWWNPPGNATTAPGVLGMSAMTVVSNGGTTMTARNVASTNMFTRLKRAGVVSTATAGTLGSLRQGSAQYTIGNGSGLGGFTYVSRFGTSDAATVATARQFVGLSSSVAAPTNVEPSTLTNSIGIGHGASDANLKLFYGGSVAQTPIDLGANFPKNTLSTDMYELILYAPTNANNVVNYRVTRLNTGDVASGTLTAATPGTQLPSSTTFLGARFWRTNNTTARAVGLDVASLYIETDY